MVIAGLVAGGSGTRMKQAMPKQFLLLDGEPVLLRTLRVFLAAREIDAVLIAVPKEWTDYTKELLKSLPEDLQGVKRTEVCEGGTSRNDTVRILSEEAVARFQASDEDILLTHDAVRPMVSLRMISETVGAMKDAFAVTAAIPSGDTVVLSADGKRVSQVPKRETVYRIQTPQLIRIGLLRELLASVPADDSGVTDLCSLCERRGIKPVLVNGAYENIKITVPTDLAFCEAILRERVREEQENV